MMRTALGWATALVTLVAANGAAAQPASGDPSLPPGPGRDQVIAHCTACHAARTFSQLREGPRGWRNHVMEMILHGAQITPAEVDPIVNYLARTMGLGVPIPGQPPQPVTLPDGAVKPLVQGACSLCHGLDRVTAAKRTPGEWTRVVERMVFYGAPLSKERAGEISAYLASTQR